MAHATIEPGAQLNLPWNRDFNALVYVLSGRGTVGPVGHPIHQGQLAVLGPGDRITVAAAESQDSNRPAMEVLLLGGKPIREPVFHYGPFVMNSKAELIEALEDYNAGRFGVIPPNALMPHRGNRHRCDDRQATGHRIEQLEFAEVGRHRHQRQRVGHRPLGLAGASARSAITKCSVMSASPIGLSVRPDIRSHTIVACASSTVRVCG